MSHYENLGTLSVRWMAVGFFVLAVVSILVASSMGMGAMTGGEAGGISDHMGGAMGGGGWMWLGPILLPLGIGFLLWAVSRPVGRAMAAGLVPSEVVDVSASESSTRS